MSVFLKIFSTAAFAFFFLQFPPFGEAGGASFAQSWKTYPYHEDSTILYFPQDEGRHSSEPVEWWYTNSFLKGGTSGKDYTFMLTYFYYPAFPFDGFRIFNIADETAGQFYPQTSACNYTVLSQNHLELQASVFGGVTEEWKTLTDMFGNLVPFEYHLYAKSQYGYIDLTYTAQKRPLIVGGTGFLYQGKSNYTYYYSQTLLSVQGTITLNSNTESVTGTAWIDRQYGNFNPSTGEKYEWFSFQLSNGMDLNVWNLFTTQNTIPDTSTYRFCTIYVNDSVSETTSDFTLERLQYVFMPDQTQCYSKQWRFTFNNIDLTATTLHDNQEVSLPFRFYEGSVEISGTVNSQSITGIGFAELLHNYYRPVINLISPGDGTSWNGFVNWQVLNPDDARKIYYDVEVSVNDSFSYTPYTQHLTDTFYLCDISGIPPGTPCWIKVNGYSNDTTLTGSDRTILPVVTGINQYYADDQEQKAIHLYPNPVTNKLFIRFQTSGENSPCEINDMFGRRIWGGETRNNTAEINVSNWEDGIYCFRFAGLKNSSFRRFVIMK